jgi:C4-dicarboxylate-specific signal transduction histidine kinase
VEVEDNAGGIEPAVMGKIFNPYFTTKKNNDGTGLGLYMSKIIIEDHCHGKIEVSNREEGAVFKLRLPL